MAAALDAPGEFALSDGADGADRSLLYVARSQDDDPREQECVVSAGVATLLRVQGGQGGRHDGAFWTLALEGLTLEHSDWALPPPPEVAEFQAATVTRG